MTKPFETKLAAGTGAIRSLLDAVEAWSEASGLPSNAHFRLMLVLEELATNVVKHGYRDGAPGEIDVSVVDDGASLLVTLRDDAQPFDPFASAPPADLDEPLQTRRIGGLGVHFVKSVAQHCGYRRADGRNETVVRLPRAD